MLEKGLIAAVHRHLPREIHHQSMTGAAQTHNGTPDQYYDGPGADLWAEYKQLTAMPRSGLVGFVNDKKQGCYSTLQYHWMLRRYTNSLNLPHGRANQIGIVGLPNRTAVIQTTPTEWREGSSVTNAIPLREVTNWVIDFCGRSYAP
jgi:hypothetical protein